MQKLINRHRIEENLPEIDHFVPCGLRIEHHSYRILHPGIGHKDPEG